MGRTDMESRNRQRVGVARPLLLLGMMGLLCSCRKAPSPPPPPPPLPQVEINGVAWSVEVAATRVTRLHGLSGRTSLPGNTGMFFVFRRPQVLTFCMRNCEIPLDIAFLDAERKVVAIHTMIVEADRAGREIYSSVSPAQYALEVAAGQLARARVQIGHKGRFLGNIPSAAKAEPSR